MFYDAGKQAAALHYGIGAVAGGLGGVALQMLLDRDLRAELLQAPSPKVHPQVIADAAKIAPLLKHLDPATARVGIGGLDRLGRIALQSEAAAQAGREVGVGEVADAKSALRTECQQRVGGGYGPFILEIEEECATRTLGQGAAQHLERRASSSL